jgi:hypothetical protein
MTFLKMLNRRFYKINMKSTLLFSSIFLLTFFFTPRARAQPPWMETTGPSNVKCFAASGDTIFAGDLTGLYLSPDNGQTWVSDGFDSATVATLAIFDGKIFAGTSGSGLFVSTNSGVSWTPDTTGFNGVITINSLSVCAPNMVAATATGLSVSTDGGASWTQELSAFYPSTLATDGLNVYATSAIGHNVFASRDRGMSWTIVDSNLYSISSLAVLDGAIFAAGGNGQGVFRSTNGGVNWEPVNEGIDSSLIGLQEFNCHYLLIYGQNLFIATTFGIYLTTDTGGFWTNESDSVIEPATGQFNVWPILAWNGNLWAGMFDDSVWVCPLSKLIDLSSVSTPQAIGDEFTAYPNPFTQSSTIAIDLSESGTAEIDIVNLLGIKVAQIFEGELTAGNHSFTWNANAMPPGMYECVLRVNGQSEEIPIVLAR